MAQSETKGSYLAALLDMRLQGEEADPKAAADAAGIDHATPRQWRRRSDAFAVAEWRARYGSADGVPIEPDAPPEPERIRHLRDRLHKAADVCADLGLGPWPGSQFQIEHKTGAYNANRQA